MRIDNRIDIKIFFLFIIVFVAVNFSARAQTPVKPATQPQQQTKPKIDTGDQSRIIHIIHADRQGGKKFSDTSEISFLSGNVCVKQAGTLFYCDSAAMNPKTAIMEAFGHVHIIDNDTINVRADYMRYKSDIKKAFLKGNVSLSDPKSTLTTSQLDYDVNTKIAVYTMYGKLVTDSSVLTSLAGTYYSESKDATFTTNVLLVDPQYTIKTDTLQYNTFTKVATFTVPTLITSGKYRSMKTSDGWWDLINKKGYFSKRPIVVDSSSTLIADEMAIEDSSGHGQAAGNVVFKDTVQNIVVLCNDLKSNRANASFLATLNPVMIIIQNGDSTFIAADTLYSARFDSSDLALSKQNERRNFTASTTTHLPKQIEDTQTLPQNPPHADTLLEKTNVPLTKTGYKKVGDKIIWDTDTARQTIQPPTTITQTEPPKKKGLVGAFNKIFNKKENTDTIPENKPDENAGKYTPDILDSLKNYKPPQIDSAAIKSAPGVDLAHNNNVSANDTSMQEEDNKSRFVEAYYNVRIYNDSMQAVGDSMYYDARDSLFQLFKNPVMWTTSSNQLSQITGDTIYLYTANQKPKYFKDWYSGLTISQADTLHNKRTAMYFNQLSGRTIEGWFTNGEIDSLQAKGDAHSVYYIVDENNKYGGVNTQSSRSVEFYFADKELYKIKGNTDVVGRTYPMRSVNHESIRLQGFKWMEDRRPKSKYELLGGSVRE